MEYVRALVLIAEEELQPVNHPRVFSLTKIVEISDFNMGRIRRVVDKKGSELKAELQCLFLWTVPMGILCSQSIHQNSF